ncbi:MAG: hypothetical protein HCA25_18435 [Dolichospermum sp. DET50]|nr:hypothetical protein [Dolichospermum sp. DET66]MBS3034189.1 hypothetical protein [Dolichospermum sp. DET67]MBS3039392.1 hypothetical protein [Dolichospermum sp. DET50]QSX66615.1 MAG: hypothetical protein EZY12_17705 [Dolichospermum sp. DET69]
MKILFVSRFTFIYNLANLAGLDPQLFEEVGDISIFTENCYIIYLAVIRY